jgi:hypothetical protein
VSTMVFGLQKLQNDLFCVSQERDFFRSKYLEQVSEIQALKEELSKSKREVSKLRSELMNLSGHVMEDGEEEEEKKSATVAQGSRRRQPHRHRSLEENDNDEASSLTSDDLGDSHPRKVTSTTTDEHDSDLSDDEDGEEYEEDDHIDQALQTPNRRRSRPTIPSLDKGDDDDSSKDSGKDIRLSAEKLLHWASYRTSSTSQLATGGASHSSSHRLRSDNSESSSIASALKPSPLLGKLIAVASDDDADHDHDDPHITGTNYHNLHVEEKKDDDDDSHQNESPESIATTQKEIALEGPSKTALVVQL